jgi:hypothetical protein
MRGGEGAGTVVGTRIVVNEVGTWNEMERDCRLPNVESNNEHLPARGPCHVGCDSWRRGVECRTMNMWVAILGAGGVECRTMDRWPSHKKNVGEPAMILFQLKADYEKPNP